LHLDIKGFITFGLIATTTLPILPEAKFSQQFLGWAKARETTLQQVKTDKSGKSEKPFRNEHRAAFDPEDQGEQDEESSHDADDAFDGHD
jgi:hypothetical protein